MITELDQTFIYYWNIYSIFKENVIPETEYKFHEGRKWLFDIAFPEPYKVSIELDGGGYGKPIHCQNCGSLVRTPKGKMMSMPLPSHYSLAQRERDHEKQNTALLDGWLLLRFTSQQLKNDPEAVIRVVEQAILNRS